MENKNLLPAQYFEKKRCAMFAEIAANGNISAAASMGNLCFQ
jgi:hypothetical protein